MKLISGNPLIERYRYSSLRPTQCWIYVSIFVAGIAILLGVNYSILVGHLNVFKDRQDMYSSLYYQFMALLAFLAWIISAGSSSTAIRTEINDRSYDFFRMLPLSAHQKAIGIMVGRNLLVMILSAVVAVAALALGGLSGRPASLLGQMVLTVCSAALFFNCAGLFSSINPSRKTQARNTNSLVMLLAAMFLLPYMIASVSALSQVTSLQTLGIPFFFFKPPLLILTSFVCLYFAAWLYVGILRKFDKETEPVMTRPGAFLFLFGIIVVVSGLVIPHLSREQHFLVFIIWGIPFLFLLALPYGFFLNREQYMEVLGQSKDSKPAALFLKKSNLTVSTLLFAIWAAVSIGTSVYVGHSAFDSISHIFVLFTFYMVLTLLREIYCLMGSGHTKITALLAFIGCVYLFLPLILAATTGSEKAAAYSMFGYFGLILSRAADEPFAASRYPVIIVNAIWIIILADVVRRGYRRLLSARAQMNGEQE